MKKVNEEVEFVEDNLDAEENEKVNEICMVWSAEEIKHKFNTTHFFDLS